MGEIESTCYTVIDIAENGIKDGQEREILFESVADYVKFKSDQQDQNSNK